MVLPVPRNRWQFVKANVEGFEVNGDVLFSGSGEETRAFTGGKVRLENVLIAADTSLHFQYTDLSRCRLLRTDLRDIDFTGVKCCDDFSVGRWLALDWFRGMEWFRRVGLYDEVGETKNTVLSSTFCGRPLSEYALQTVRTGCSSKWLHSTQFSATISIE